MIKKHYYYFLIKDSLIPCCLRHKNLSILQMSVEMIREDK